jgi:UDP-N-acetylglucosamine 2-epimerase (non-hydrolysing)
MIVLVAGARPNYPKVAPLYRAFQIAYRDVRLVDTGQHYDDALARAMREDLHLPEPDVNLKVGSKAHGAQTAEIMLRFERLLAEWRPELVVVVGDVNSTLACALVTAKAWADGRRPLLAHVEAGLRSDDRTMPEEINRRLTDAMADLLFTTEPMANVHLAHERIDPTRVHFVGNVMVDSLLAFTATTPAVTPGPHIVATVHRPSTVDQPAVLEGVLKALEATATLAGMPVLLVCHPRTQARVRATHGPGTLVYDPKAPRLVLVPALRYGAFVTLLRAARLVLTDSGGIQEETTVLGVPCLTLRDRTERPITVEVGTNRLVGVEERAIVEAVMQELHTPMPTRAQPLLWDGHAAERIVPILCRALEHPCTYW